MSEIIFDQDFPLPVKTEVEKLLNDVAWLLPLWTQRLRVGWNREEGIIATMRTEKDYRYCRITFHPEFLEHTFDYRRQILFHEFFHVFNTPAVDYANEIIEMLCDKLENEELKTVCIKQVNAQMEASAEDFAYCLANKFKDD